MTSCLPLMLLGSVPMMLQADVSDPAFLRLAEDQRPASSLSSHESIVDIQPPGKATAAPAYRRFSTYERRAQSATNSFVMFPDQDHTKHLSDRKRRAKSVPVNLGFATEHESWIGDSRSGKVKGKGKQRGSSLEVTIPGLSETYGPDSTVFSESRTAPRRRRSEPSRADIECSSAGPSLSSQSWKLESPSTVLPSPQLETLEEEVELKTLTPAVTHCALPWSRTNAAHEEEPHRVPDSDTLATSYRSLKRVSFSSGAIEVIPDSSISTNEDKQGQPQSTWANILFMNAGSSSRPTLTRQSSLPSVRGQAAGRSILKRTSSFSDCNVRDELEDIKQEFKLGLPSTSKSSLVHFLQPLDDPPAPKPSPNSPCDYKSEASLLCNAVQATVHKAEKIVVLPARPRKTKTVITRDERNVRHWSIEGSNWTRRSGIYASPRAPQPRMPREMSTPQISLGCRV